MCVCVKCCCVRLSEEDMAVIPATRFDEDAEGDQAQAFAASERKLGPAGTTTMAWCPRMDLVALGTQAGRVSVCVNV